MVNTGNRLKFYLSFLLIFVFILSPTIVNGEDLKVFDDGALFTPEEIERLNQQAIAISNNYEMDVIIVTTNFADGKTSREYADDYFDENGFGFGDNFDGILFLIDMDNREAYISTSGEGIRYFTDKRIEEVLDKVFDSGLKDGNYFGASMGFLNGSIMQLERGILSNQYSQDESVKEDNRLTPLEAGISLGVGGLLSGGFLFGTKSRYKMKNPVKPLNFRENSFVNLALENDLLINTVVNRRKIPRSDDSDSGRSTTHTSSSGRTHGGGGRKF